MLPEVNQPGWIQALGVIQNDTHLIMDVGNGVFHLNKLTGERVEDGRYLARREESAGSFIDWVTRPVTVLIETLPTGEKVEAARHGECEARAETPAGKTWLNLRPPPTDPRQRYIGHDDSYHSGFHDN